MLLRVLFSRLPFISLLLPFVLVGGSKTPASASRSSIMLVKSRMHHPLLSTIRPVLDGDLKAVSILPSRPLHPHALRSKRGRRRQILSGIQRGTMGGLILTMMTATLDTRSSASSNAQSTSSNTESDQRFSQRITKTRNVNSLFNEGVRMFEQNQVERSVECFDQLIKLSPPAKPFLWQRGLSLYYAGKFQEGADQFKTDVQVNPNDTEEAIWYQLCNMRRLVLGQEAGKATSQTSADIVGSAKLFCTSEKLQVGTDPRPVMRAVSDMFNCKVTPSEVLDTFGRPELSPHDDFYAKLYVGLWNEGVGDMKAAQSVILQAVEGQYGKTVQGSEDYMYKVAKVHAMQRGWLAG